MRHCRVEIARMQRATKRVAGGADHVGSSKLRQIERMCDWTTTCRCSSLHREQIVVRIATTTTTAAAAVAPVRIGSRRRCELARRASAAVRDVLTETAKDNIITIFDF